MKARTLLSRLLDILLGIRDTDGLTDEQPQPGARKQKAQALLMLQLLITRTFNQGIPGLLSS